MYGFGAGASSSDEDLLSDVLRASCACLRLPGPGFAKLLHGCEVVPHDTEIVEWPGRPRLGNIVEYQLVVQESSRTS
eukprot:4630401-Amphidinium_carterae.1